MVLVHPTAWLGSDIFWAKHYLSFLEVTKFSVDLDLDMDRLDRHHEQSLTQETPSPKVTERTP